MLRELKVRKKCKCKVKDLIQCSEDDYVFEWTYGVLKPSEEKEFIPSWFEEVDGIPRWFIFGEMMPVEVSVRQWFYLRRGLKIFLMSKLRPGMKAIDNGDKMWLAILYEASGLELESWENVIEVARSTLFYILKEE